MQSSQTEKVWEVPARIEAEFLFKTRRHYQGCGEADVEAAMSVFGPQMDN